MLKKTSPLAVTIGVAAAAGLLLTGPAAHADTEVDEPSSFTSAFTVMATPGNVVNNDGVAAPGEEGATGTFTFRINSDEEIICYDIRLEGVSGDYESPARTATHIHQADAGQPGPPRIAFPNPEPVGDGPRTASGCLQGPFTTGIENDGVDTGEGFSLAEIEANPAGFSADSHTADFAAGVVRGQLTAIPVGGVDTGAGGTA
ncbi:CHRD domain-containing protein, partial [Microbacterium aurantiacum]